MMRQSEVSQTVRPITAVARWRAWNEPVVRGWLFGALVLLIIAGYSATSAALGRADQNWLLSHGTVIEATVWPDGRSSVPGLSYPADGSFTLRFPWKGKVAKLETSFPERREVVLSGSTMILYLDPNDATHWTMKSAVSNWQSGFVLGTILATLALLLLKIASLLRRQRLRWFVFGELIDGVVMTTKTTPIAPLSQAVICTARHQPDLRSMIVYLPRSTGRVQVGDDLKLICVANRSDRVLAAAAYGVE